MALLLSDQLKSFFIDAYAEALENTVADGKLDLSDEKYRQPDVLSIAQHLEETLDSRKSVLSTILDDPVDWSVFNLFLPSLRQTVRQRKLTMGYTSLIADLTDFIRYICLWLNSEKEYYIDVKLISRRKSLTSELKKILIKSLEHAENPELMFVPPVIRDRFGIRFITANDDPKLLLELVKIIVSILTNSDSIYFAEFTNWLKNTNSKFGGEQIPRERLLAFLKYNFTLGNVKNYILNPKPSSYESWQGTFTVDATSPNLGGFMFELQARTLKMHKNAEYGLASHHEYKEEAELRVSGVFEIGKDEYDGLVFYAGKKYPNLDMDGYTAPADILSRHVSPHVVPETIS